MPDVMGDIRGIIRLCVDGSITVENATRLLAALVEERAFEIARDDADLTVLAMQHAMENPQ